jgi:5-methylcytosine-specific restriction endonuclease McrA
MEFKQLIAQDPSECKIHFVSSAGQGEAVLDIYLAEGFEEDQQFQRRKNFSRKYVISLIGLEKNTYYLFAGVFEVLSVESSIEGQPYFGDCLWKYNTVEVPGYEKLVGRLLVKPKDTIGQSVYRLACGIIDDINVLEYLPKPFDYSNFNSTSATKSTEKALKQEVEEAYDLPLDIIRQKSKSYPSKPKKTKTYSSTFKRNPYVVVEALRKANGICGSCLNKAPFISKSTAKPYLEVHHMKMLADGGDDTVENTIALCPNCHREKHFG